MVAGSLRDLVYTSLAEWYSWLSARSNVKEYWIGTPAFAKRIPKELDQLISMMEYQGWSSRKSLLGEFVIRLDRIYTMRKTLESTNPPKMEQLMETMEKLWDLVSEDEPHPIGYSRQWSPDLL